MSRLIAYIRRPSGVTTTPLALLGNGAVAITELFAVLISVIPPPPLLTYTIAGCGATLPATCAADGVGPPNQVTKVIISDCTNHPGRDPAFRSVVREKILFENCIVFFLSFYRLLEWVWQLLPEAKPFHRGRLFRVDLEKHLVLATESPRDTRSICPPVRLCKR